MAVGAPEGLRTTEVYVRHGDGVIFFVAQRTSYEAPGLKASYLHRRSCNTLFGAIHPQSGIS